jgi:cytochrome c551/c552
MKPAQKILLGVVALLVLIQLYRPAQTNPPVTGEVNAPPEVARLLRRACYDCHSNETKWPWYANVAPVSWLVTHHVDEGRRELNFSTWASYPPKKVAHKLEETEQLVQTGEMPMKGYVALHPEAKLTDAEKQTLLTWAKAQREAASVAAEPTP